MCEHYNRNCKIIAPCCNKVFDCRLCHDKFFEDDHKINRYDIKKVICNECQTEQDISNECTKCKIKFGKYYCNKCNFFDNDDSKRQFHCDKCNICRVGGQDNFYHCDECNSCIHKSLKDNHNCIKNTDCPICFDDLIYSTKSMTILKCGHSVHVDCFNNMIENNVYNCPLCLKTCIDNTQINNYYENLISQYILPEELNYDVKIFCNDCCKESTNKFHIIKIKCTLCNGFNTKLV